MTNGASIVTQDDNPALGRLKQKNLKSQTNVGYPGKLLSKKRKT